MVHHLIGQKLLLEDLNIASTWQIDSHEAMVIVETRPAFWFPYVVANAVRTIGWNLYIFATEEVFKLLGTKMRNITYRKAIVPLMNVQGYSNLLTSTHFWNSIQEEHVLIFQSDCFLWRPPAKDMLKWSYIGPLCGSLIPKDFIMNGGLSLRKKSDMIIACGMISSEERETLPEDVAFTRVMRSKPHSFMLPTMDDCFRFAIESIGDPITSIGIHGTDKYYASTEVVEGCVVQAIS